MKAVYAGSFDPVTLGHIDIIERAAKFADELIIAVSCAEGKQTLFDTDERVAMLRELTASIKNIRVERFTGLVAAFLKTEQAGLLIRGIRGYADLPYETVMAHTNRGFTGGVDTCFLLADPLYAHISGGAVREIARLIYGGETETAGLYEKTLSTMAAPVVIKALERYFRNAGTGGNR